MSNKTKTKLTFIVNRTFTETTPESASEGCSSDNGFVYEGVEFTLEELKREIRQSGMFREEGSNWFSTGFDTSCFETGTEREESLHIELKA